MTLELDLLEAVRFAEELARRQGRLLLKRRLSIGLVSYKDRRDLTTEVDLEVERNLRRELKSAFPSHGFSGEETGDENPDADWQWLIDPIDGTKNFASNASLFSISIGLSFRGEPILGVVHNAPSGECFYASQGAGAFQDQVRLKGPAVSEISSAIVNIDTPSSHRLSDEERRWFEEKLVLLTRRTYRVRALGLGSLAACWVANGALDAYVDLTGYTKPQDLAAGRVIMKEAGLRVERIEPRIGPPRLVAAPPILWDRLLQILGERS